VVLTAGRTSSPAGTAVAVNPFWRIPLAGERGSGNSEAIHTLIAASATVDHLAIVSVYCLETFSRLGGRTTPHIAGCRMPLSSLETLEREVHRR